VEGIEVSYRQGVIDRETNHLLVLIQGRLNYISIDITDIAYYELILGIPWLRITNPRIDWTTGQIFWDNAITQLSVAIKDDGRNSVTKDSIVKRLNELAYTPRKRRDIPLRD
jgi:hypothetical protein